MSHEIRNFTTTILAKNSLHMGKIDKEKQKTGDTTFLFVSVYSPNVFKFLVPLFFVVLPKISVLNHPGSPVSKTGMWIVEATKWIEMMFERPNFLNKVYSSTQKLFFKFFGLSNKISTLSLAAQSSPRQPLHIGPNCLFGPFKKCPPPSNVVDS